MSYRAMQLAWPADWHILFDRIAPLVLEIGFGHADFLMDYAHRHPEWNIIGIERAHSPMEWAEKKLKKNPLPNVRLVYGDALMALYCLFPPESLHEVHINFSDPWPKRRHVERRLIDTGLIGVLVSRLTREGTFYIATDITDYAEQIQEALTHITGIENCYAPLPHHTERDHSPIVTHYEQKAIDAGRPRYYFHWRRTGAPVPQPEPIGVELDMPNIAVSLPLSIDEIAENFETGRVYQNQGRVVKFLNAFRQMGFPKVTLDTHIEEPLFTQRLMIGIRERTPHDFLITFEPIGFPRVTPGLHDAVYYAAQQVAGLHPEGKITDAKVQKPK